MLGLFSKKAMILGAPAAGQLLDITQVNDPFFASKNLGDGVAVIPQSQTVCAPCDGRLVMVFETRHAFGIRCGEVEVQMQGQGFTALKKVNDRVRRGEPIIRFDRERLSAYDLTVMMFVTQPQALHWQKHLENSRVEAGDRVMTGERL